MPVAYLLGRKSLFRDLMDMLYRGLVLRHYFVPHRLRPDFRPSRNVWVPNEVDFRLITLFFSTELTR